MKWPTRLVIVRHAQSTYNFLRVRKERDPIYKEFEREFAKNHQSERTKELAKQVGGVFNLSVSDANTPITTDGTHMARVTAAELKKRHEEVPDVIFVSPYLRTQETLSFMKVTWPELEGVKVVFEDRIREQEHGLSLLYNDRRVFQVMHPEQKYLRDLLGPYWYQYPQGESVSQVRDRIRSFIGTLIREYSEKKVMLVTHHLTILCIRAILERMSPEEFIHLDEKQKPVNCGVTIYRGNPDAGRDGHLELEEYNTRHY